MAPTWGLAETGCVGTAQADLELPRIETIDRAILAGEERAVVSESGGVPVVAVGPPLPRVVLEIRDKQGRVLPDRHVGEIWLSSDSLFSEYNADPELTARVLVGDWINTGDRGYLAEGFLYFTVREKDLIVIGGEKYMPDDIEAAINRVPGVREGCAVSFGIINEDRGTEELAAVVETREEGDEVVEQLVKSIRNEVMRSIGIALRYLVLTPPGGTEKTTSGKIARTATRERHLEALLKS
jgi:acyl-CoA synthetase (AMP-forming)/AMP-acid ligase II